MLVLLRQLLPAMEKALKKVYQSRKCLCGFCCGCGWYVIPDTQYTLTRKHHFSTCTLYIASRLLAALTLRHTH